MLARRAACLLACLLVGGGAQLLSVLPLPHDHQLPPPACQNVRRYEELTSGSEVVESQLKGVLAELLNAEVVLRTIGDVSQASRRSGHPCAASGTALHPRAACRHGLWASATCTINLCRFQL